MPTDSEIERGISAMTQLLARPKLVRESSVHMYRDSALGEPPAVTAVVRRFVESQATGRLVLQFDIERAIALAIFAGGDAAGRRALERGLRRVQRRADALCAAKDVPSLVRYLALQLPYPVHLHDERTRALVIALLYQASLDSGRWPGPTLRALYGLSQSTLDRWIADARYRFGYLKEPYSPERDRPLSGQTSLTE
jgi:hypothetical protein